MKNGIRHRLKMLTIFLAICLSITFIWISLNHSLKHRQAEEALKAHIANIENDFDFAVRQVYPLQSLIMGASGNHVDLKTVGSILERDEVTRFVDCVLLAPNGVVDQVYPLEGNEYILGTNLFSAEYENADAVIEAQKTGKLVISYPYTTETGRTVVIARLPVYLPDNNTYKTWGIVSVCVAFPEIFENLRTDILRDQEYAYRITAVGSNDDNETELTNFEFYDINHFVSKDFTLADMQLRIEAAPQKGWLDIREALFFFLQVCIVDLLLAVIIRFIYKNICNLLAEAKTDELTGLINRTFGEKEINRILQSKNFQKGIFLMMDMDNFKTLNDTFGHKKGDDALIKCAESLKSLFRKNDIICRLGGDEFVVFLPYSDDVASFADKKVHNLLQTMRRNVTENGVAVPVSMSIGLALAPDHGTTFNELYVNADTALYRSKALGRDCCTIYDGPTQQSSEISSAASNAPVKKYSDRRTILIVDDDFINRALIKNIFSDRFNFIEAENGQQGLDKIDEFSDDLCAILVDASMPVMNGLEMLRVIHKRKLHTDIPLFMITAYTENEIAKDAYAYGVRDVITKPITPVIIQNRIQTVIELYQARDMLKHIMKDTDKR